MWLLLITYNRILNIISSRKQKYNRKELVVIKPNSITESRLLVGDICYSCGNYANN